MTMIAAVTADAGLGIWAAYGGIHNAALESSIVRTGDRSFDLTANSRYGQINFSGTSEIYIRWAIYFTGLGKNVFHQWFSGGSSQGCLRLTNTNELEIRKGDAGGSVLDTTDMSFTTGTWYVLELKILIDGSSGEYDLRVDGTSVASYSGDTDHQGTGEVDKVRFRNDDWHEPFFYLDDVVINNASGTENNSWPGLGGLYYLKPNAAGDQTDLTPDTGSNHERVDEIEPDDDDSYVESDVVDEYDLYELENLPADGVINAAIWHARAKLSESGEGEIARMLKISGTEYQGSDEALGVGYADAVDILDLNPDDSAAWEKADIDALQAGVKVR